MVYYRSQYSCIFHYMVILTNEANVVIILFIECTGQFTKHIFLKLFKISYFDIQWVFVCLFESIWSFESTAGVSGHTTLSTQILAAQRNCQPIRIVFVFSSQKSSGCICKSKWRSTTSISANKWLEKCSSSSMFSTPSYHNPIYDPVGFASGIFDRYKVVKTAALRVTQ